MFYSTVKLSSKTETYVIVAGLKIQFLYCGIGQFFMRYFGNLILNCVIVVFSESAGGVISGVLVNDI